MLCLLLVFASTPALPAYPLADGSSLSGDALYKRVRQYASFGAHRTGTPSDQQTSEWLRSTLAEAGFSVTTQPFKLEQYFPEDQYITLENGDQIPTFPHWFPRSTKAPITAPVAPFGSRSLKGQIAYLAPKNAGEWYALNPASLAQQAKAKGAQALVIAVAHPSDEIYATNAGGDELVDIPTVMIAARDAALVSSVMQAGESIRLTSTGQYQTVTAHNIIARYPAHSIDNAPWIVISTPSSGWFQCAGERGTGIALWLGLASHISQLRSQFNWLFVANSGHELDMLGAALSLSEMPEAKDVKLWLHLGASIAARDWRRDDTGLVPLDQVHRYNRLYAAPTTLLVTQAAFTGVPNLDIQPSAALNRRHSELGMILEHGYPALGLVGSHHFFHTPADTPTVTSPELLAPYGQALSNLARFLNDDQRMVAP